MIKYLHVVLASAVLALVLLGCGSHGDDENSPAAPPTDFQDFVRQLLASTAENTDPVPINPANLTNLLVNGDPKPITFFRP